jgi:hypothetical protein
MIRAGLIGVAAVVVPGAALGAALVCSIRGLGPFVGALCVTYPFVGALAWVCVRVAHFTARLAVVLTALPFTVFALVSLRPLYAGDPVPFFLWVGVLALAVLIAWAATGLAKR